MIRTTFIGGIIGLGLILATGLVNHDNDKLKYPEAKRVEQVDVYHGVQVSDPYRWMEDTESEETKSWIDAQEHLLNQFLEPGKIQEALASRIKELSQMGPGFSAPVKHGTFYYYTQSEPGIRHSKIMRRGAGGEPELILDMNKILKGNQTFGGFSISDDGSYLIYKEQEGQSPWGNLRIFDIQKRHLHDQKVSGVRNATSFWDNENRGFYYVGYGDTEKLRANKITAQAEIRFHDIGSNQNKLIFTNPGDESWAYNINLTTNKDYLVISVFAGRSSTNMVYLKNLKGSNKGINKLIQYNDFTYTYLGNRGSDYWFYTNQDAPRGKIIKINRETPEPEKWQVVIPETEENIQGGSSAGGNAMAMITDKIVLLYRLGPIANLKIFDLNGKLMKKVDLKTGWIPGFTANRTTPELFYSLNTFSVPTIIYRLDLKNWQNLPFFNRQLPINPDDYESKYVFYKSKDGTRVPMFVAYKKGLKLNGKNPVYMYAYGFGGWVAVPWYQPHILTWLDMGGIYAMPGIRGGGEYGESWEEAGIRLNRQNAIDDYIKAAEYLVRNQYTSSKLMVANGWSASGSLTAAAVMQRPDLFGAGMIGIPSLDLLRYTEFTPFKGWTSGYGSPENEDEFKVLYSYSPYHNIKKDECYPPILVTAGEKDQTTPPQHAYKFIARMQYNQSCNNPVLLKIVRGGGHSFGTTPDHRREVQSQEWAFLIKVLKLKESEGIINKW